MASLDTLGEEGSLQEEEEGKTLVVDHRVIQDSPGEEVVQYRVVCGQEEHSVSNKILKCFDKVLTINCSQGANSFDDNEKWPILIFKPTWRNFKA